MAQQTYIAFVGRMISKYEGGYGWNKKDPGGPTKYGITCWDLAEHMGQKMDSMTRWAPIVQNMTLATAEEIYQTKYANSLQYNALPAGVDTEVMDYGVNSGIGRPPIVLRAILGIKGSGPIDAKLLAAINAQSPVKLIDAISQERLSFMHAIRGGAAWQEFGGGWGSRVADLKTYSEHLAAGDTEATAPPAVDLTKTSLPKASHSSPNTGLNTIKTVVITSGTTAPASNYAGLSPVLTGCLVGGIVIAGVGAYFYQKQKADALNVAVSPPVILPPVAPVAPVAAAA